MPTWGTVLAPAQIDDLVALLSAWREKITVRPSYDFTLLLDLAQFALSQQDTASARLHISRALEMSSGEASRLLDEVDAQIGAGDYLAANQTLAELKANWPYGNSQAGQAVYAANCAACHGVEGEGGVGKSLRENAFVAGQSNRDLALLVSEGRPGTAMSGFAGKLSDQEIADVVAWLRAWGP
jgi:mono/diheme cytochrome c family protein